MKPLSCSMHLFKEGEEKTAELGRKRYEELKKDLEGMGLKEKHHFGGGEKGIVVCDGYFWAVYEIVSPRYYNAPLLLAIAGQRPDGGVGCIIKFYSDLVRLENIEDGFWNGRYLTGSCKGQIVSGAPPHLRDLATIEELIEAFPPTENAHVEKEPRKIKKGYRLRCDERNYFTTKGQHYYATSDEFLNSEGACKVTIIGDDGVPVDMPAKIFTIANEEEPVKEERNWKIEELLTMDEGGFIFELTVSKDGIHDSSLKGSPDTTDFLRYALQRHDQLKSS